MATYEKRRARDGQTYYRVRIKGVWQDKQWPTKAAARAWAEEREVAIRAGRATARRIDLPLADAIARYREEELPNLADTERPNRDRHLEWWEHRMGGIGLRDLSRAVAEEEVRRLSHLKLATRNRIKAALSAVLSAGVEWEWLDANPLHRTSRRKRGKGERETQRDRVLAPEEWIAVARECRASSVSALYPLVAAAYTSGGRQGELLKLQWSDLRWPKGDHVQAEVVDTKNGESRVVYFPSLGGDALRELARTPRLSRYVFAREVDATTERPKFPTMAWRRALERAGIEDFRFHDLRHCWACNLLDAGATLPQLMILGGWRSPIMVRRYASRAQRHGSAAVDALAQRLPSS